MKKSLIVLAVAIATGFVIGLFVGRLTNRTNTEVRTYIQQDALTEWQIMELAIYKTESEWDLAVGKGDDWGCGQLTQIYIDEVSGVISQIFFPKRS